MNSAERIPSARLNIAPSDQGPGSSQLPRRIQVIDSHLNLVAKGFGALERELPAGVYRIVVESDQDPFDRTVVVRPGVPTNVAYPNSRHTRLQSAAPVPGSTSMHEYTRRPLDELTRNLAREHLVVMATRPDDGKFAPISLAGLAVSAGLDGRPMRLQPRARHDADGRWAASRLAVRPGGHILRWEDGHRGHLAQALWVPQGWSVLVFLGVPPGADRPDLEQQISLHLLPVGRSFATEWSGQPVSAEQLRSQTHVELAVRSLSDGRMLLDRTALEQELVAGKIDDPLLGIVSAHLLLCRDRKLPPDVFDRLEQLVPGHPDVAALRLLAGVSSESKFRWPPMLRRGFEAARAADWTHDAIVDGSDCDLIRSLVLPGGVWTRWRMEPTVAQKLAFSPTVAPFSLGKLKPHVQLGQLPGGLLHGGMTKLSYATAAGAGGFGFVTPEKQSGAAHALRPSKFASVAKLLQKAPSALLRQVASFAASCPDLRGRPLQVEDLAWTGLNSRQAAAMIAALPPLQTPAVSRPAPKRRKPKAAAKKKTAAAPSPAAQRKPAKAKAQAKRRKQR